MKWYLIINFNYNPLINIINGLLRNKYKALIGRFHIKDNAVYKLIKHQILCIYRTLLLKSILKLILELRLRL